jgi:hypothetical protein
MPELQGEELKTYPKDKLINGSCKVPVIWVALILQKKLRKESHMGWQAGMKATKYLVNMN